MTYRHKFPTLANFFGTWFPDADIEERTDEETATAFVATGNILLLRSVQAELICLLQSNVVPWQEIGDDANRYFEDEADCRRWLLDVGQALGCQ